METRELHSLARRCLQEAVTACVAVPQMPRFKKPDHKLPARAIFAKIGTHLDFDRADDVATEYPWGLRSSRLVRMVWDNSLLSSSLSLLALRLDARTWAYFQATDSEEDSLYLLAVAKTTRPADAHKRLLTEFFHTGGEAFGAEFLASPPTEVLSPFSKKFLAECSVAAADAASKRGYLSESFWEEVQDIASHGPDHRVLSQADVDLRSDRLRLVKSYLSVVMPGRKRRRT